MAKIDRGYGPLDNHMYMYDLGWLIKKILEFQEELDTAIDLKTIHYADPIQWDITTQYSPNTVVVDPKTGTAYMSKVPVPAGIQLDSTDYWVVIFNYQRIYDKIMSGVAFNDKENLEASKDISKYDFVWFGGDLYQAQRDIPQGSKYVPGVNIVATTIADALATYYGRDRVAQVINDTLTASETQTIGAKNRVITVTGDQTVTAGDIAETSANRTIKTTADYHIDVDGNLSDHVDGVTTVNRGGAVTEAYGSSLNVGVTGTYTAAYSGAVTETYKGKRNVTGKDSTETYTGTKHVQAENIVLSPNTPLTYGTPQKLNDTLYGVPYTAENGDPYFVLTGSSETVLNELIKPSGDTTGTTDLANMQKALDSKKCALLDDGIFYLNAPLKLSAGNLIRGAANTEVRMTNNSEFAIQKNDESLDHIKIMDLKITAHESSTKYALNLLVDYPSSSYTGFRYSLMQNVWIHNFYGCLNASAFWSTLFINSRFVAKNTGVRLGNSVNNINFIACQFSRSDLVESGGAGVVMDSRNSVENYNIAFLGCDCEKFDVGYKISTTVAPRWINCYWEKVPLALQLDSTPQAIVDGGNVNVGSILARIDNSFSSKIYKGLVSIKNVFMRVDSNTDLYAIIPTSNVGKVYCSNINIVNNGTGKCWYLQGEKDRTRTQLANARATLQNTDISNINTTKYINFESVGVTENIKLQPCYITLNNTITLSSPLSFTFYNDNTSIETLTLPASTYNAGTKKQFTLPNAYITNSNNFKISVNTKPPAEFNAYFSACAFIGEFQSPTLDVVPII